MEAVSEHADLLFFAGEPILEPIATYGSMVMNSDREIIKVMFIFLELVPPVRSFSSFMLIASTDTLFLSELNDQAYDDYAEGKCGRAGDQKLNDSSWRDHVRKLSQQR